MDRIVLTDREAGILRDISFARMKVLNFIEIGNPEALPVTTDTPVIAVRLVMTVFDFFHNAMAGNEKMVRFLTEKQNKELAVETCDYYDGMITDYQAIMTGLMEQGQYTAEDVTILHKKMKAFLKGLRRPPPRILYIADCHFYHDRICREMDHRGFSGYEELNDHMIRQWNDKVNDWDHVYILGDFSISRSDATEKVLSQLNGKLHLIVGNHDKYLEDKWFERRYWFQSIEHYKEIRDKGRNVILSHYPVFCYKGQYRRDGQGNPLFYMLYGHVHNTHDEQLINRFIMETRATRVQSRHSNEPEPIPCNMINCFCMFSNYQPLTLDEWIVIDQKRREGMKNNERAKSEECCHSEPEEGL